MSTAPRSEDFVGVVELLNRSGQVVQRLPVGAKTLRVGRSYDNDLILSDPYVCPHHLELSFDFGAPQLTDLGSVNGTYAAGRKGRIQSLTLSDGDVVQFGHSQLRYRRAGGEVAPTLRDTARHGLLSMLGRPWLLIGAALLAVLSMFADDLLDSPERVRMLSLAGGLVYPLMGVFTWAGIWSLLNRVITHRANFAVHLTISFLGVAALFLTSQSIAILGFALGAHESVSWFRLLGQVVVLTLVIFAHLRYTVHGTSRRQLFAASIASLVLFGAPAVGSVLDQHEFSSLPYLDPLLRPPGFRVAKGEAVDEFFSQAEHLRRNVDRMAGETEKEK